MARGEERGRPAKPVDPFVASIAFVAVLLVSGVRSEPISRERARPYRV